MRKKESKENTVRNAKAKRRHERVYKTASVIARAIFDRKLRYKADRIAVPEGNYLVLSNHNTDFDFVLVGTRFKRHMYFVASEHVYQKGWLSVLLRRYCAPIARIKGVSASSTVMSIVRALRKGDNVCIFAEGNRSYNGLTCPILPATGKLAKTSGVSLITFRIEGGYLTSPRWSYTLRKGRMRGSVVNIYSPEQLNAMTADEVNEVIRRDLHEDAYARQEQWHVKYKGKRLAEGLEHALFICPDCGATGTMHSEDDKLCCTCGMIARYDEYGSLSGTRFNTVTAWDIWQMNKLYELIDSGTNENYFSDDGVALWRIDGDHRRELLCDGTLSMNSCALTICDHSFPLAELEGLGIYGHANIVLTHNGTHYELIPSGRLCASKYIAAYGHLRSDAASATLF